MAIALMTPICESKAYCWHEYVRGVVNQDYPKDEIFWLFVVQEQGLARLPAQIEELKTRIGHEYAGIETVQYRLPFADEFFDPRATSLTWKERALFAAHLRAVGFKAVAELFPEHTHVLSLGCDVCLNTGREIGQLQAVGQHLVSGVILARLRHFPLVLHYERQSKAWSPWYDYPKDRVFTCDWTGMDILMLSREIASSLDLMEYRFEKWGGGEDNWFCMEARERGVLTYVDPTVTPWHIHEDGVVLWTEGEVPKTGIRVVCPTCGWTRETVKSFVTRGGNCPRCGTFHYRDPWWATAEACALPYQTAGSSIG